MTGISTTERSQGRYNQLERSRGYHTTGRKSRDIIPLEGNRRGYPASNRWDDSNRCVTVRIIPTMVVRIRDRHGFTKCHMSRRFSILGELGSFMLNTLDFRGWNESTATPTSQKRVKRNTKQPTDIQREYQPSSW